MTAETTSRKGEVAFYVWSILPIVASSAATVLGTWAALDENLAVGIRTAAIVLAVATCAFLVFKARRDRKVERTTTEIRYDAFAALRDKIAPALRATAQLTLIDPAEHGARAQALRSKGDHDLAKLIAAELALAFAAAAARQRFPALIPRPRG